MTVFRARGLAVAAGMMLSAAAVSAAPVPGAGFQKDQVAQAGPLRLVPREREAPAPEVAKPDQQPGLAPGGPASPRRAARRRSNGALRCERAGTSGGSG